MICKDDGAVTEEVLPPLFDRRRHNKQFQDIRGGPLELRRKWLAKICNGVALLGENCTHAYPRSMGLNRKWWLEIWQGEYRSFGQGLLQMVKC